MPAYLIPLSGNLTPITLRWGAYIIGRQRASTHEVVVKEHERSITDNSDFPFANIVLMDKTDFSEFELRLPYKHKTKLATQLASTPSGFYVLQYVGGLDDFIQAHGNVDILVNGKSLETRTSENVDGLILTDGDEITFTEGAVEEQEFTAESFRYSLQLNQ